jgi:hypothetical protein
MNTQLITIGGGVTGGALSNGIAGLFPATANPMLVNGGIALVSGFGVTKITGTDTKSQFLRSMLIGSAIIRGIGFVKNVFEKTGVAQKLTAPTKVNRFLLGATGLGCPDDGLMGTFTGADGQLYEYDESGLSGTYMDENGQVHEIDDGLNAVYVDEYGNPVDDGLNAVYVDEYGNPVDDGLNAVYVDEYGNPVDDGLNGYEEEAGLFGFDDEEAGLYGIAEKDLLI